MKIKIRTDVYNGKFRNNINRIIQIVKSYEGKEIELTFAPVTKKRSVQQNSYYWGVVIPIMQNTMLDIGNVMDFEDVHLLLRAKFLREILAVDENTGEVCERVKSTTELSTTEFMDYINKVRMWAIEFFEVEIPEPNEQILLKFEE
jgi:hypothetical protein